MTPVHISEIDACVLCVCPQQNIERPDLDDTLTLSGTMWPPALIISDILFFSHGHFTSHPIKTETY